MNTYQSLELNNGETIKLTLNLKRLLMLKTKYIDLYRKVNKTIMKGPEDLMEMVDIIYAGYLCALESGVEGMSYESFLDMIPQDIGDLSTTAASLITAKKK